MNGARRAGIALAVVAGALVPSGTAPAAPGDLDPSFSQDGKATFDFGRAGNVVETVAVDAEKRIYVAGAVIDGAGSRDIALARLLPDGSPDPAFSGDGVATVDFELDEIASAVEAAPGGGAYVVSPTAPGEGNRLTVLRFGDGGELDPGFSGDGIATTLAEGANAVGRDLAVVGDGDVLVAGTAHAGSESDVALAKFNPDGSLDDAFGAGGSARRGIVGTTERANAIATDSLNRILVGGGSSSGSLVARFLPSGESDPSFSEDGFAGGPDGTITDLATLESGAVVGAGPLGRTTTFDFHANSFLTAFDADGRRIYGAVDEGRALAGIATDQQGGLIVASSLDFCPYHGGCAPIDFVLDRFLPDGSIDSAFGDGRRVAVRTDFGSTFDWARTVAVGSDGRIVVAGVISEGAVEAGAVGAPIAVSRYSTAPGPRDSDADGVVAGVDLCERAFAPQDPQGCVHFSTSITLGLARHGRVRDFRGVVSGSVRSCVRGAEVEVIRTSRGRDRTLGSDLANGNGKFVVAGKIKPGRYRALIRNAPSPFGMCDAARSRSILVRAPAREGRR